MTFIWFLVLLGPLVFFHELGHFLAAKAFRVKVLRFSLGFGPVLLKRKWGETEYCLSGVPLGGYVSMVGDDPEEDLSEEDKTRTLSAQKYWKKIIIVVAGPFTNFLLPILFYFIHFMSVSHVPPPLLGTVLPGMSADRAGLRSGDRVVAINGSKVRSFDDFRRKIMDSPNEKLKVTVERPEEGRKTFELVPDQTVGKNMVGLPSKIGRSGVFLHGTLARAGVVRTDSDVWQAGLRSGDRMVGVTVDGVTWPLRFWSDWENILHKLKDKPFTLHVISMPPIPDGQMMAAGLVREMEIRNLKPDDIVSGELIVAEVSPKSPAQRWGISPGDRMFAISVLDPDASVSDCKFHEKPMGSYAEFEDVLQRAGDARLCLSLITPSPDGNCRRSVVLRQDKFQSVDRLGNRQVTFEFGVSTLRHLDTPEDIPVEGRFVFALSESFTTAWEITSGMVLGIGYMITGTVDRENVGSVVMIAQMAHAAAERGLLFFLQMMALISLNLGLLNLLPIPMLDGGHVVMFTIEAVRRKPLGLKARSIITYIGLGLIVSLMVFGFRNDLVRCFRPKQQTPSRVEEKSSDEPGRALSPQPEPGEKPPCEFMP